MIHYMEQADLRNRGFIAPGAVVVGNVMLEEDVNIWFHATVRADADHVHIGAGTNIQDNVVIHVDAGFPVDIGRGVSVGHSAVLHGCSVGDDTLVGMGAIVLNGAIVGRNCLIGAGALVTQDMVVPDGSLVIGSPGHVVRELTEEEIEANRRNAEKYKELMEQYIGTIS